MGDDRFSLVYAWSGYLKRSYAGENRALWSMTVADDLAMTVLVKLLSIRLQVRLDLCFESLLENPLSSASGSLNQHRFHLLHACRDRAVWGTLAVGHTSLLQMICLLSEGYAPFLSFLQSTKIYSTPIPLPLSYYECLPNQGRRDLA